MYLLVRNSVVKVFDRWLLGSLVLGRKSFVRKGVLLNVGIVPHTFSVIKHPQLKSIMTRFYI